MNEKHHDDCLQTLPQNSLDVESHHGEESIALCTNVLISPPRSSPYLLITQFRVTIYHMSSNR